MKREAVDKRIPGEPANRNDRETDFSLLEDAQLLWEDLSELIHTRLHLTGMEIRQAGKSLASMLIMAVFAALLLITAWLGLLAAGIMKLREEAIMDTSAALLLTVGINLLVAFILYLIIRRKSRHLQFPATVRSFQTTSSASREPGDY
jgi:uncharacterized membrane protein YqjE